MAMEQQLKKSKHKAHTHTYIHTYKDKRNKRIPLIWVTPRASTCRAVRSLSADESPSYWMGASTVGSSKCRQEFVWSHACLPSACCRASAANRNCLAAWLEASHSEINSGFVCLAFLCKLFYFFVQHNSGEK